MFLGTIFFDIIANPISIKNGMFTEIHDSNASQKRANLLLCCITSLIMTEFYMLPSLVWVKDLSCSAVLVS